MRSGVRAAYRALAVVLGVLLLAFPACGGGGGESKAPAQSAPQHATAAADPARGRSAYDVRCSPCHGLTGGGDGPAAIAITPKPRNFRDADFWKGRTAVQLRLVVKQGRPGTLMPPFEGILSDTEIDDVVAYVQTFRPAGS